MHKKVLTGICRFGVERTGVGKGRTGKGWLTEGLHAKCINLGKLLAYLWMNATSSQSYRNGAVQSNCTWNRTARHHFYFHSQLSWIWPLRCVRWSRQFYAGDNCAVNMKKKRIETRAVSGRKAIESERQSNGAFERERIHRKDPLRAIEK